MATIDYCVIAAYLILVTGLGLYLRKRASRNLESYFLGGKKLPWWALAASGAVSNFDITGTMWMVTVLYLLGMQSWWHHWMWGVMLPAFGLAYMAKWVRRSKVITGAEWMITRFGDGLGGRTARMAYAVMAVVTCVSFIGYAFQGIGKFAHVYVDTGWLVEMAPFAETLLTTYKPQTMAIGILALTTLYVVLGGLFGVIVTDIIQTVILSFACLLIGWVAFTEISPEMVRNSVPDGWESLRPVWRIPEFRGTDDGMFEMFGLLTIAWIVKGFFLNAGGPGQLYDFQRYLAARDPRDAAKVAALWPFFLTVRWMMVAGIALLAISGIGNVTDPELVMPMVLQKYLPTGLKGLVIAGLLAAFMSTFSSTANSGASYVVRDIWQPLFRPHADERHLVRYSYIATIGVVVAGIIVGLNAESIRSIWGWIMMALGGAVIMPNVLRWYWWRLNGWGYAAGTLGGIVLSLAVLFFPDMPTYVQFPLISIGSLLACLVVSLATAPNEPETLQAFYRTVRPFGMWRPVRIACGLSRRELADPAESPWRMVGNTLIACCGVTGLYLFPMYLVGHWYGRAGVWFGVFLVAAIVLYFTWYRWLPRSETANGGRKAPGL
jgi:SSS family solute:Na+ symporter